NGEVHLVPDAAPYAGKVAPLLDQVRARVDAQGVVYEDKGITGSVHYRTAEDPEATKRQLLEILQPLVSGTGLAVHEGRMVLEIRPEVTLGKGAAVRRLVETHGLQGCVFAGDDTTDTDAFRALRDLRASGSVRAACVGVLSPETPPAVLELSDFTVDGVPGVVELLSWLEGQL
ncbi:MAG: trehalose-phosphatase, partial [Chloroflexota bacterium]|nr:trehalose-phosphatase [Chloroflexota bacterium]